MPRCALAYRLGFTPWERYLQTAAASIEALLYREEAERSRPLGRALDLGCGWGEYTVELARRAGTPWASTTSRWRSRLMLAFGPTPLRSAVGWVSEADVRDAFAGWDLISVELADTTGLGWPLSKTLPQWYRLRRQA